MVVFARFALPAFGGRSAVREALGDTSLRRSMNVGHRIVVSSYSFSGVSGTLIPFFFSRSYASFGTLTDDSETFLFSDKGLQLESVVS